MFSLHYCELEKDASCDGNHCKIFGTYQEVCVGTAWWSQFFLSPPLDGMSFNIRSLFGSLHNRDCTMLFWSIFFPGANVPHCVGLAKAPILSTSLASRRCSSYPLLISSLLKRHHCSLSFCSRSHLKMPLRTKDQPKRCGYGIASWVCYGSLRLGRETSDRLSHQALSWNKDRRNEFSGSSFTLGQNVHWGSGSGDIQRWKWVGDFFVLSS